MTAEAHPKGEAMRTQNVYRHENEAPSRRAQIPRFIADRVRFELTVRFHVHTLSRRRDNGRVIVLSAQNAPETLEFCADPRTAYMRGGARKIVHRAYAARTVSRGTWRVARPALLPPDGPVAA